MFSALQAPFRPRLELPQGQQAILGEGEQDAVRAMAGAPPKKASTHSGGQRFRIHNQEVTATA